MIKCDKNIILLFFLEDCAIFIEGFIINLALIKYEFNINKT